LASREPVKLQASILVYTLIDDKLGVVALALQGLEREYDRLLSENDGLKRRLARFDVGFSAADKKSA
jgi:hypothetical protein